jgi:primosomal protein N' (replication factor Y)
VVAALLDAAVSTSFEGLGTEGEALRRWLSAASLVRPAPRGGSVFLVGDAAPRPTNAFVQWNPVVFAQRELEERRELNLPPAVRMATMTGDAMAVEAFLGVLHLPASAVVLGPTPLAPRGAAEAPGACSLGEPVRAIVRCAASDGEELARSIAAARVRESASRRRDLLRIELDPRAIA